MLLLCVLGPQYTHAFFSPSNSEILHYISSSESNKVEHLDLAYVKSNSAFQDFGLNSKHRHLIENENEEFECTSSRKFVESQNYSNKLKYFQLSAFSIYTNTTLPLGKDFSHVTTYKSSLYLLFEVFRI
ncbi:hypothetical protein [Formosa sp. S-31]|uniref:hypothetical protein n=1 Tax=Formosa sp. S-31 TaxID=2790949 RepID=UPI003EB8D17A